MAFELVYVSQAGNRSYWTMSHHFSKNDEKHCTWNSTTALTADLSKLYQKFPTIFAPKNKQRFYVEDGDNEKLLPVADIARKVKTSKKDNSELLSPWPNWVGATITKEIRHDHKYFAVAISYNDSYHFLDTTLNKNGGFVYPFCDSVRRWKEADKAAATAEMIISNTSFWTNYPKLNSRLLVVLDLRDGKAVWKADKEVVAMTSQQENQLNTQIEQLSARIHQHLNDNCNNQLVVTDKTKDQPHFDFVQYNAADFFASLKYILQCLAHKEELNKLLGWYDGKIIQDQLHVVELSDLTHLDAEQFVHYLQETRKARRNVKDLATMVNTVADKMDFEGIINSLNTNQSLANSYQFRDHHAAEVLQGMMKQQSILLDD